MFLTIIFLLVNLLPFIILIYHFTGNLNSLFIFTNDIQTADYFLHYPFWILQITIIESLVYFLIIDVIQIFVKKRNSPSTINWIKNLSKFKIGIFVFFLLYVGIRTYFDTNTIKTSSFEVEINNLPAAIKELNLALISDIQIDRYTQEKKIERFHEQLEKVNPDLIFFAGDIVTSGKHFIPMAVKALCNSQANLERIACLGDHDVWSDSNMIVSGLKNCDWETLNNQHHIIEYEGARILVTGITYVYDQRISQQKLNQILAAAPEADLKILLVHQPANVVKAAAEKNGYNLLLAGHTHGGQVVFRPFGIPLTPTQVESPIYRGHHKIGDLNVIITNGIGMTMWPIRYQAPAEIVKINLK